MSDKQSPPTFQAGKQTWTIKLTHGLLDSVQAATQIDLAPDDNDITPITGLLFASRKLGAVLWECVKGQADSQGVTVAEFKDSLDGEALTAGWGALVDAIVFFIHCKSPKLGESVKAAIEAEMRVVEAGAEEIVKAIQSTATDEAMRARVTEIGREMQQSLSSQLANSATR